LAWLRLDRRTATISLVLCTGASAMEDGLGAEFQRAGIQVLRRFGFFPNGKRGCLCGRVLRDAADEPSLYVRLSCRVVFLHAPCAVRLGEKLMREGRAAEG
jgi:hypothetical protein